MKRPLYRCRSLRAAGRYAGLAGLLLLLGGCAQGDFGGLHRSLVHDGMHDWVGPYALAGEPASGFPLTSDERLLRDLAYPLIAPPYQHGRLDAVMFEYGAVKPLPRGTFDRFAYAENLLVVCRSSPSSAYAQLIDDVRNDLTRMPQFFTIAAQVHDLDEKRRKSLFYISAVSEPERVNAIARARENAAVIDWVRESLVGRALAYRFALERLAITAPDPQAVEGERVINQLKERTAFYFRHLPPPWRREPSLARAD